MNALAAPLAAPDSRTLAIAVRGWAEELGFTGLGIANIDLPADESFFSPVVERGIQWRNGLHVAARRQTVPPRGTHSRNVSCISVRMNYWPRRAADALGTLAHPSVGYVSRYALGRDYHKVLRSKLQKLCDRVRDAIGPFGHRVFTDSAPVLEKALARNAGLGWIGKHTNLIDRDSGSYFFLGEIYLDLKLPADAPSSAHCGTCSACMPACPTGAIVAPFRLDARRCISYLTIELHGAIPVEFRAAMGNRIYGCDDCQLACPWNKFAKLTVQADFAVRHELDHSHLVDLFAWSEADFLEKTRGMAIRRLGHERWLRNIAVALGNAPTSPQVLSALNSRAHHPAELVREHVQWALARHLGP